ncbi:MAG: V-type ATP synthase subunit D, partial [Candidatus Thermoplasmatota archaeon]|nr:V-type ATP synthase subunit D [Candidatus Thermoplasmatota archaeon]
MEVVEGINPTRMELLAIRKKRTLAEKGHKLLGEKRDALIVQFFDVISRREGLKNETSSALLSAKTSMEDAMAILGYSSLEAFSAGIKPHPPLDITNLNIMGVKVPVIGSSQKGPSPAPWGLGSTPQALDDAKNGYENALGLLLRLAEAEGAMERLALEIERTKRRVNALEHIFIPRLRNTERYITMQLQEREREDFVRRKRIKALMEA